MYLIEDEASTRVHDKMSDLSDLERKSKEHRRVRFHALSDEVLFIHSKENYPPKAAGLTFVANAVRR